MRGWGRLCLWAVAGALASGAPGFSPSVRAQDTAGECELHVWPTDSFYAVYHDANVGMINGAAVITGMNLTPMLRVAERVRLAVSPADQISRIDQMNLGESGRFAGYRVIFHDPPTEPRFANWIDRTVGQGPRQDTSIAPCYAELHVIFITLFRTALSKKIQTVFLFRDFAEQGDATFHYVEAGSTGAPEFDTEGEVDDEAARVSVQDAFAENLQIFLRKRRMRERHD